VRHDSTLKSSAAALRKRRVSRESPPLWSKADQLAGYDESEEMAAVAGPTPGTLQFVETATERRRLTLPGTAFDNPGQTDDTSNERLAVGFTDGSVMRKFAERN
jgi:hypothetical protein